MPQIFISYSRKDLTFIERLAVDLEGQGCDVWYDLSGLDGGSRWVDEIEKQIKQRPFMIVVLSPDSIASEYVNEEVVFAKQLKTKKIIPLYYRPCEEKMLYASLNRIDVQGKKYEGNFNNILRALGIAKESSVGKTSNFIESLKLMPEFLPHPTKEWIEANKILLSNGMEFMCVPAGKFLMGITDEAFFHKEERPQHIFDITYNYWMARFPVTNAQYNKFVKKNFFKGEERHPVDRVSWNEAMEYCQWLNNQIQNSELRNMNLVLRLPTEGEWEKAARGTDGRAFPWGDQFDNNNCNVDINYMEKRLERGPTRVDLTNHDNKSGTTPVNLYSPHGDSPYGCADMIGNVQEWTHSLFRSYPYKLDDGREDEKLSGERVIRSNSFESQRHVLHCAYRRHFDPNARLNGFRVCLGPLLPT